MLGAGRRNCPDGIQQACPVTASGGKIGTSKLIAKIASNDDGDCFKFLSSPVGASRLDYDLKHIRISIRWPTVLARRSSLAFEELDMHNSCFHAAPRD